MKPPAIRRAFTLIEVLVSLAIFAIGAVVLSAAYVNVIAGYRAHDDARDHESTWQLARLVVVTESDRAKVEAGGTMNLPDQASFAWSTDIEPTTVADLFSVTLHVEVTGATPWTKEEHLLLYRPGWSDAGDRDQLREDSRQKLAKEKGR